MTTTVGGLIDRMFRTYLEPPDHKPATCALSTDISDSDTSVILTDFALVEDEDLLRVGIGLEIERELLEIVSYDSLSGTAVVLRGVDGTTAAAHLAADHRVKIAPPYPRQSCFEAVADNIITLYPKLFSVNTDLLAAVGNIVAVDDDLAVEVIEVLAGLNGTAPIGGRMVDYHPAVGGRAVVLDAAVGDVWIKYRRRFGSATSETDTLVDLGLDPRWETIVMCGACADLFAGRDLPASHVDFVGSVLAAENIPVGTRTSLAGALRSYRDRLMVSARDEMKAEYRTSIRQEPVGVIQMDPWG